MTALIFPRSEVRFLSANYDTDADTFFYAICLATQQLRHSSGCPWLVDGWNSRTLFLRVDCSDITPHPLHPPVLEVEFDMRLSPSPATVGVVTRLTATADLFHRFTSQLDGLVPRRRP